MDIDLLSKMVKELILDNDRVVLPGLGSFVAEIVPSMFSDRGYTINPPYRKLYFRSKPSEGDELVDFYAKENNLDKPVAERIVKEFIRDLKKILFNKKLVTFPGLGRLRATRENNIFFIADENLDIYPAGFALEPISLKTHQETREEVSTAVGELKSIIVEPALAVRTEIIPESEPVLESPSVPEPEPLSEPVTLDEVESLPELLPASEPELEKSELSELLVEPLSAEAEEQGGKPKKRILLIIFIVILSLVIIAFAALAVVGRTNPELIERFLYSAEELEILNHQL